MDYLSSSTFYNVAFINIIMLFFSCYISYASIRRYLKMPSNFEFTLYWGLSFMVYSVFFLYNGLINLIKISYPYHYIQSSFIMLLALWFQLYALSFFIFNTHNNIARKKIRVYLFSSLIFIVTSQLFLTLFFYSDCQSLQFILLESFNVILASTIFLIAYYKKNIIKDLHLAFSLLFISRILSFLRLFYKPKYPRILSSFYFALVFAFFFIIFLMVNNILKDSYRRKNNMLILKQSIEFIKENFFKILSGVLILIGSIAANNKINDAKDKAKEKEDQHKKRKQKIAKIKDAYKNLSEDMLNKQQIEELKRQEEEIQKLHDEINNQDKVIEKEQEKLKEIIKKREIEEDQFDENEADEAYDYLINDILDD